MGGGEARTAWGAPLSFTFGYSEEEDHISIVFISLVPELAVEAGKKEGSDEVAIVMWLWVEGGARRALRALSPRPHMRSLSLACLCALV